MQSRTNSRTYGTVSLDKQKQMVGLEFVRGLVDRTLPLNTIARTLGYDTTEAGRARRRCRGAKAIVEHCSCETAMNDASRIEVDV